MEEKNTNKKAYTFSDVLIVPKYSEIESRRNVDISSDFGKFKIELPIFSANMKSVTEEKMAIAMCESGGMGVLHRFCSVEVAVQQFLAVKEHFEKENTNGESYSVGNSNAYFQVDNQVTQTSGSCSMSSVVKPVCKRDFVVAVSIGVQEDDKDRYTKLHSAGARIFVIDVAHGHHILVKRMIEYIKSENKDAYIIAGNVATKDGAYDLAEWGANAVRVGIGAGRCCMTRSFTGVGVPMLSSLQEIKEDFIAQGIKDVKIISDGGVQNVGDICKALKFADAVMVGSFVSGTAECSGHVFKDENGIYYKVCSGSASGENKVLNNQTANFIEGISRKVQFRGKVKYILSEARDGICSCFSYVGANNLQEFQEKCEFIEITDGGRIESKL